MASSKSNLFGKRKPEDGFETKLIQKKHKEVSETREEQIRGSVELSETKSDEANLNSLKETVEGLDETPDFVEDAVVPKRTVAVRNLSFRTQRSDLLFDINEFFKDVGQVVRIRLVVNRRLEHMGFGFVEFASSKEAKKALKEKNREYLHGRQVFVERATYPSTPKYCIDHKAWYEEECLPIEEDDETPPDFVEQVAVTVTEKTLFFANLSPQATTIFDIISFFKDVVDVVSVRLVVNHEGKHVGYGFVEFACANTAKRALKYKNGAYLHDHKILLMKVPDETPDFVEESCVQKKTLFVGDFAYRTKISHIIDFFKDVGQVVRVRLIVNRKVENMGFGFVEFASSNEAKKALQEKNGEYLHNHEIVLTVVETAPYPLLTNHCIDHYVWYEDYLRGESILVEEDAAVEGLDETPDFLEEVAVREKTVFVASLSLKKESLCKTSNIMSIFKSVGEIVRVRFIVDDWGDLVGCVFVEFASANEAKKAVQEKTGSSIRVKMAEIARSYPFRPKYNLYKLAQKLWYEDKRLDFKTTPGLPTVITISSGTKTTFPDSDDNAA